MLDVMQNGRHVATIVKLPKAADAYHAHAPWALLHNSGRVDRFATQRESREEARKSYPGAKMVRA